jgi:RecB family exonuclease
MSTYRRCRLKYRLGYIDNLDPKPGIGLIRGSVMHAAVAAWYGCKYEDQVDRLETMIQAASNRLFEYEQQLHESFEDEWYLIDLVLKRYAAWSQENDNDDFEEVLSVEEKFVLELEPGIVITGYIDGLVRDKDDQVWLLEHKFLKQVSRKALDLDAQISMYLFAAHEMGWHPKGVFYNMVRMTEGGKAADHPVDRVLLYRNPEGMALVRVEIVRQIKELLAYHAGKLPTYRNPQNDCFWSCGFHQICLSLNFDGQADELINSMPKKEFKK